jgi:indolepyruvate decarboxylase
MQLKTFLFDQLWNQGVRHIFGIPGDFVLNLYEALEDDRRFQLVRLSHEPGVGFAADGAARITNGLAVCCVTYGAGGLNLINPIACAYAEESPLIVLSGGPGNAEKRRAVPVHHEVKSFESQLKVYQEVTQYAAILDDPLTSAFHISKAVEVALKTKRPVYIWRSRGTWCLPTSRCRRAFRTNSWPTTMGRSRRLRARSSRASITRNGRY